MISDLTVTGNNQLRKSVKRDVSEVKVKCPYRRVEIEGRQRT